VRASMMAKRAHTHFARCQSVREFAISECHPTPGPWSNWIRIILIRMKGGRSHALGGRSDALGPIFPATAAFPHAAVEPAGAAEGAILKGMFGDLRAAGENHAGVDFEDDVRRSRVLPWIIELID
jgi:hypothetical protein